MKMKFLVIVILAVSIISVNVTAQTMQSNAEPAKIKTIQSNNQTTQTLTLYGSFSQGWGLTAQSMSIPGPQITFQEGQPVNLTIIVLDGMLHNFHLDYNGNGGTDAGEPISPSTNSMVSYEFTPDRTGSFTYYCTFHLDTMYGNVQSIPEVSTLALIILLVALTLFTVAYKRMKK